MARKPTAARKTATQPQQDQRVQAIDGTVQDDAGDPVAGAVVTLYVDDLEVTEEIARATTDKSGRFAIDRAELEGHRVLHIAVSDREGRILISPDDTSVYLDGGSIWIELSVSPQILPVEKVRRPTVRLGHILVDALTVADAEPKLALDVARALVGEKIPSAARQRVAALFPEVVLVEKKEEPLCYTSVLEALYALIALKGWSREIALSCDAILRMDASASTMATVNCPNFSIRYDPTQVDPDMSAAAVYDPGSNPPVKIGSLPAAAPPTYIKRVCFWLERALAAFTGPPFSMLNPASRGRMPVVINTAPYGKADKTTGTLYLNNKLNNDLLCAVAVHELFHIVQFEYGGDGTWQQSVFEGGAVFAEDTAADFMNRYLEEADTFPFSGEGVMRNPNVSLETGGLSGSLKGYKSSLFWRYISEQQSGDLTEPFIGVETYRRIIELCSRGSYSASDVKQAIRELPWHQDFYDFGYLDRDRLDLTSSETTLGNYALACRLKDLGVNVPDRRFEFMEDEQNIHIHQVLTGDPSPTTLASVRLTGSATITTSSSTMWSYNVNKFAHRYYEVDVDPAVTNIQVDFTAGIGLTSRILQIALIDANGAVRDIHRTDAASYRKRITNDRGGVKLAKLLLVVTGCDASGSFTLSAASAAPAPDVMVTRWHTVRQTEYEIDSIGWAWTWISPDIYVDNDLDGIADNVIYFNTDNKLHVRLHNKGNASASGISVEFWYQDATPGLLDAAWLRVQNTDGITQTLTGLSLAAGASGAFSVDWAPVPSGRSHHFCIRAVVSVPGDPNTDNKRVLSNFGNVVLPRFKIADIELLWRNVLDRAGSVTMRAIPRFSEDIRIEPRDLRRLEQSPSSPVRSAPTRSA